MSGHFFLSNQIHIKYFKVVQYRSTEIFFLGYYDNKSNFNKSIGQPKDHIDHWTNRLNGGGRLSQVKHE